jgi:hypothetical protein
MTGCWTKVWKSSLRLEFRRNFRSQLRHSFHNSLKTHHTESKHRHPLATSVPAQIRNLHRMELRRFWHRPVGSFQDCNCPIDRSILAPNPLTDESNCCRFGIRSMTTSWSQRPMSFFSYSFLPRERLGCLATTDFDPQLYVTIQVVQMIPRKNY